MHNSASTVAALVLGVSLSLWCSRARAQPTPEVLLSRGKLVDSIGVGSLIKLDKSYFRLEPDEKGKPLVFAATPLFKPKRVEVQDTVKMVRANDDVPRAVATLVSQSPATPAAV